ncbi:hypothetical protein F5887DRAFT_925396 [Amanita rubescens]|nr:hypothetical protein F5887DRAFT_925396 [Amanita rubescens]
MAEAIECGHHGRSGHRSGETTQERLTWVQPPKCDAAVDDSEEESAVAMRGSVVVSGLGISLGGNQRDAEVLGGRLWISLPLPYLLLCWRQSSEVVGGVGICRCDAVAVGTLACMGSEAVGGLGSLGGLGVMWQLSGCRGGSCQGCRIVGNSRCGVVVVLGAEDERNGAGSDKRGRLNEYGYAVCLFWGEKKKRRSTRVYMGRGGGGLWQVRDVKREEGARSTRVGEADKVAIRKGRVGVGVNGYHSGCQAAGCDAEVVHEADMCCKAMRADGLRWLWPVVDVEQQGTSIRGNAWLVDES